jgi:hypothetical protein
VNDHKPAETSAVNGIVDNRPQRYIAVRWWRTAPIVLGVYLVVAHVAWVSAEPHLGTAPFWALREAAYLADHRRWVWYGRGLS